ncbi:MAG: alpha,alpha-trehalase TreF [Elusimicrobia bacterium]|nr:alpha,alpha-trehalase TreF [Elusimicrobiota bacterium]
MKSGIKTSFWRGLLFTALLSAALVPARAAEQVLPPDIAYGELFSRVQLSGLFKDSKTFPDARPLKSPAEVMAAYEQEKSVPGFSLEKFVSESFILPPSSRAEVAASTATSARERVSSLWRLLERPADASAGGGSLLALPHPYVVPGGRFREIYYWDSYFTSLGLAQDGQTRLMTGLADNFAYLISTYGHIPNGNRTYYLSRSQPPYFTLLVKLLVKARDDPSLLAAYVPAIEKEYAYWMDGAEKLKKNGQAFRRAVKYGGALLNRYWDDNDTPRPEAYAEDIATAKGGKRQPRDIYRDIRAAAESGMDFSSRWFADGKTLSTAKTTSLLPVDLNCLLYDMEMTLHDYYKVRDAAKSAFYLRRAESRKKAVNGLMYDKEQSFYTDFDFVSGKRTGKLTLAGMAPFFLQLAPVERAAPAAMVLREHFLKSGGFATTLVHTGQQWDAPNGWAPLQWIAVRGLLNYGQDGLAFEAARRWTALNEKVFLKTGKMMEKYNVEDTGLEAGGGEYPGQDGFGWTNGVYLAMKALPGVRDTAKEHDMGFVEHDGCKLYYQTCGSGSPLVLLHGLGADGASWLPVLEPLSKRFTLIVPDNRFSGRSECPGTPKELSIKGMAADVKAVLDALGVKKAHIAGHSMGGYVAQEFALAYPGMVDALVLEDTAASTSPRNKALFSLWARRLLRDGYSAEFWEELFPWLLSSRMYQERPQFPPMAMKAAMEYPYLSSPANFARLVGIMEKHDTASRLKDIKARTMVLSGELDILITPPESGAMCDGIKGAGWLFAPGAGHTVHLEMPEFFAGAVSDFLSRE